MSLGVPENPIELTRCFCLFLSVVFSPWESRMINLDSMEMVPKGATSHLIGRVDGIPWNIAIFIYIYKYIP